jgi:transposase
MYVLPDEKIFRLAEAFERGYSRSQAAKYAGVCERTAVQWRGYAENSGMNMPALCGCGRPIKHLGRCRWRREQSHIS